MLTPASGLGGKTKTENDSARVGKRAPSWVASTEDAFRCIPLCCFTQMANRSVLPGLAG